ncbi:MAG: DUF421 domain-containing protein [Anaerolineae bacterium]
MLAVVRAVALYLFLLVIFRLAGQRTVREMTTFDLILLMVVGEATQQALLGEDFSLVNGLVVIATLIAMDIGLSLLKQRFPLLEKVMEGVPLVILEDGRPIEHVMAKERIDKDDIMEKARELQGLERLDQIRFAILEKNGTITIIPK